MVIGGVAAGLSAAARARRLDASLEIIVLEKGGVISWSACGLPYYVEGRVSRQEELTGYTPDYFRRERNISVRTGARVAAISHPRREVALEGGERLHYDRLVVATGARPDTHGIAGTGLPHVFGLYTLEEAGRLREFLRERHPRRGVVIGGGYIGLEAADALRRHGVSVTVLEAGPNILHREDAELTCTVRRHLERFRIELRCGEAVRNVEDLAADVVVAAAGIRPNVEIASEGGIETGRTGAIRTDERMETNLPGVYAAGDCAEATQIVTGRPVYIPLGTTANKMGRVAGANAAGARERFPGVAGTSIVSVCGLGIGMTGLSAAQARAESFAPVTVRIESRSRPRYFRGRPITVELVADGATRRLLGGTVVGEDGVDGRVNVIAAALQNRMKAEDFESLDLCYAPPFAPVWDPLLIAAQQLVKAL